MRIIEPSESSDIAGAMVPNHVAVIMDGNRRWAHARGIAAQDSYLYTAAALASTVREAHRLGIGYLTLFCLSAENLSRPSVEVDALLRLSQWLWPAEVRTTLGEVRARVAVAGDVDDPRIERAEIEVVEDIRNEPHEITVTFAVNYGSRQEMARALASDGSREGQPVQRSLYHPTHPDIDLVVRTSGEQRLSNFMLWQSAFAELVFTDTLWPDFTGLHLSSAVLEYTSRRRRIGR